MRRMIVAVLSLLVASPALAQTYPPPVTAVDLAQLQAQIPVPSDAPPPPEVVWGASGSAPTFRRSDAAPPRISRSGVFTVTGTSGLIGGSWRDLTGALAPLPLGYPSYPMFFTGIGPAGSMAIDCFVITSSASGFQAQCRQGVLTLSLLSAPISILAPSGTQIYALALPSTQ